MLYLMRKIGESIVINENIEVKVVEIKGKSVKLGFESPSDVSILRKEIQERIIAENLAAAKSDAPEHALNAIENLKLEGNIKPKEKE